MKDLSSICAEWGSMIVICFACGALVYQEHVQNCPQQISSASIIKYYLKNCMIKCGVFLSISHWPLLIVLFVIYATTVFYFQTFPIAIGGFFAIIVMYQMLVFYLQKNSPIQKHRARVQTCNYVSQKSSNK